MSNYEIVVLMGFIVGVVFICWGIFQLIAAPYDFLERMDVLRYPKNKPVCPGVYNVFDNITSVDKLKISRRYWTGEIWCGDAPQAFYRYPRHDWHA